MRGTGLSTLKRDSQVKEKMCVGAAWVLTILCPKMLSIASLCFTYYTRRWLGFPYGIKCVLRAQIIYSNAHRVHFTVPVIKISTTRGLHVLLRRSIIQVEWISDYPPSNIEGPLITRPVRVTVDNHLLLLLDMENSSYLRRSFVCCIPRDIEKTLYYSL